MIIKIHLIGTCTAGMGCIMKQIIEWLISMEQMAGGFYSDAASLFKEDKKLSRFLNHLAKDEGWHCHMMKRAADFIRRAPQPSLGLTLDNENKTRIEEPLRKNERKLVRGTLTKESVLDCIVATEFSEWNYFCVYALNTLKEQKREFTHFASKIEHHKRFIERFFENLPDGRGYLKKIRRLPKVWNNRILIVEYNKPLCTLLSRLLSKEGVVEIANNGNGGLRKVSDQYFDIVLLSVLMPDMNGIDVYKKVVLHDSLISNRTLLLFDGNGARSHLHFAKKNKIPYLVKPFCVRELKEAMHDILSATPKKTHGKMPAQEKTKEFAAKLIKKTRRRDK